jgi:hypothetical protein
MRPPSSTTTKMMLIVSWSLAPAAQNRTSCSLPGNSASGEVAMLSAETNASPVPSHLQRRDHQLHAHSPSSPGGKVIFTQPCTIIHYMEPPREHTGAVHEWLHRRGLDIATLGPLAGRLEPSVAAQVPARPSAVPNSARIRYGRDLEPAGSTCQGGENDGKVGG